jgi:hypothetical protein
MTRKIFLLLLAILGLLIIIFVLWQQLRDCRKSCPSVNNTIKLPKKDSVPFDNSKLVLFTILHKTYLGLWTRADTIHPFTKTDSFPLASGAGIYVKTIAKKKFLYINDPMIPADGSYKIMGIDMTLLSGYGADGSAGLSGPPPSAAGTAFTGSDATSSPGAFAYHQGDLFLRVRGMGNGSMTAGVTDVSPCNPESLYLDLPVGTDEPDALIIQTDPTYRNLLLMGYPGTIRNYVYPPNTSPFCPFFYTQPIITTPL